MLDNMIDLWAKKSLDEKVYNYCQVNKNHILSIDFEDDIQINLINGVTYFAFYDVFTSMDSLGLVFDKDGKHYYPEMTKLEMRK